MLVDVDDTIIEVHGYAKQGAGFGYSGVRGLNALLATVTTAGSAPVVVAQRLRKGSCGSPRGAKRLVADALKTVGTLHGRSRRSRCCGRTRRSTGRPPSVPRSAAGPRCRSPCAWTPRSRPRSPPSASTRGRPIEYTDAVFDEATGTWVSRAEVAEVPFTAFTSKKATEQVPGRLVVRRIPDLNPRARPPGRAPCSTPGASTPSSPPPTPPTWTPWPRTRPTAATRSSSRSTPT